MMGVVFLLISNFVLKHSSNYFFVPFTLCGFYPIKTETGKEEEEEEEEENFAESLKENDRAIHASYLLYSEILLVTSHCICLTMLLLALLLK
jgi:hypothetical protein